VHREGQGEDGVKDVAKLREASFGKYRRLTGTLWDEISFSNYLSSPPWERSIRAFNVSATKLPGVELPGRVAGEVMTERCPAEERGGMKDRGAVPAGEIQFLLHDGLVTCFQITNVLW